MKISIYYIHHYASSTQVTFLSFFLEILRWFPENLEENVSFVLHEVRCSAWSSLQSHDSVSTVDKGLIITTKSFFCTTHLVMYVAGSNCVKCRETVKLIIDEIKEISLFFLFMKKNQNWWLDKTVLQELYETIKDGKTIFRTRSLTESKGWSSWPQIVITLNHISFSLTYSWRVAHLCVIEYLNLLITSLAT